MHDLVIALIAAGVVVVGGGGTGAAVVTRRRRARPGTAPAPAAPRTPPPARPAAPLPGDRVEERPAAGAPPVGAPAPEPPTVAAPGPTVEVGPAPTGPAAVETEPTDRPRLKDRLGRARTLFGGYLAGVRQRDTIDQTTWDELEEALILGDVGVETTSAVLDDLRGRVKADGLRTPDELIAALRSELVDRLRGDLDLHHAEEGTTVWLFVGVNGVGKTTTIGKVGLAERQAGRSVVLAAGDTFRAAAAEQLATWGERIGAEVVRGNEGGDPGAVIFDAVQHAAARHLDLVLGDTAGRLHTKVNLMEELKKVRRVAERPPGRVTEVLLVLDATTGQNGLIQAKQFAGAVGVTGVVLTKLDGTAKGGIALAVRTELGIPIKLVGLGEAAGDLVPFDPTEFVDALIATDG